MAEVDSYEVCGQVVSFHGRRLMVNVQNRFFKPRITAELAPDALILRIQPDEGISLRFGAKVPGHRFRVRSASMDFSYGSTFREESPEAYERLLFDALIGDPTLFIRSDEVEQAWRIVDPILEAWQNPETLLATYPSGSWGPRQADQLIERVGRQWRRP